MDPVLDRQLELEILSHLVVNRRKNVPATGGNLILAVEGRPGEGKTFHCKTVLGRAGVSAVRFQLSEFESQSAGVPAVKLVEAYLEASEAIAAGTESALLIEDMDLALGPARRAARREIVQYTMNRDLVVGAVMSLCDSPLLVDVPDESKRDDHGGRVLTRRVPIIITGNDFSNSYPALLRPGRARHLRWEPARETRLAVVQSLFESLGADEVEELVGKYRNAPIAFWASVADELERDLLRERIGDSLDADSDITLTELIEDDDAGLEATFDLSSLHSAAKRVAAKRGSR